MQTESPSCLAAQPSTLNPQNSPAQLVAPERSEDRSAPNHQLSTLNPQPPTIIETKPLPAAVQSHKARRKGRVACLPKVQRDMVNRMLSNGVPYKNIVCALDEVGFNLSERNISTWATGGYLEWRFQQDLVLQNRLDQDDLVDHLRRDDASELPEVGLQAAATRLSQLLVQKTACADNVEANLGTFSQMVDVLCRLNRELAALQKQRDDSRRALGRAHDPARIKEFDQSGVLDNERFYSDPPSDSTLAKPAIPPFLPPTPTSTILADGDREEEASRQLEHSNRLLRTLQAFSGKKAPVSGAGVSPVPTPPGDAHPTPGAPQAPSGKKVPTPVGGAGVPPVPTPPAASHPSGAGVPPVPTPPAASHPSGAGVPPVPTPPAASHPSGAGVPPVPTPPAASHPSGAGVPPVPTPPKEHNAAPGSPPAN